MSKNNVSTPEEVANMSKLLHTNNADQLKKFRSIKTLLQAKNHLYSKPKVKFIKKKQKSTKKNKNKLTVKSSCYFAKRQLPSPQKTNK